MSYEFSEPALAMWHDIINRKLDARQIFELIIFARWTTVTLAHMMHYVCVCVCFEKWPPKQIAISNGSIVFHAKMAKYANRSAASKLK